MMNLDQRALNSFKATLFPGGSSGPKVQFEIPLGDEIYVMDLQRKGAPASHTSPAEENSAPKLSDCAVVIWTMFRRMLVGSEAAVSVYAPGVEDGMLRDGNYTLFPEMPVEDEDNGEDLLWRALPDVSEREEGLGEVDVEAGWEAYRREITETMGPTILPAWEDAPEQLRECFAAGIWKAIEPVAAKGVVAALREENEVLRQEVKRLERVVARHWEVASEERKGGAA